MKYKVDDDVRVISDNNYGFKQGYIGKITRVDKSYGNSIYLVDGDYWYGEDELVFYSEYPLYIFPDGKEIYAGNATHRTRGFQALPGFEEITLPTRATKYSAGYDLAVTEDITLLPGETKVYTTGLCAYMLSDEYLAIHVRSSLGIKHRITLSNSTGIVDSDYVQSDNGGHIMLALTNNGAEVFQAAKGDRVAQGIFMKYLVTDDDNVTTERNGGWGSTGN